jgi:hypothetical protein
MDCQGSRCEGPTLKFFSGVWQDDLREDHPAFFCPEKDFVIHTGHYSS